MLSEKFSASKSDSPGLREIDLSQKPALDMLKDSAKLLGDDHKMSFRFAWQSAKKDIEYFLCLSAPADNKPFIWHLFAKSHGFKKEVWKHATYDVLLINNLLCTTCGDTKGEVQLDRVMLTSSSRFITVPGAEGQDTMVEKGFKSVLKSAAERAPQSAPEKEPTSKEQLSDRELVDAVAKSLQDPLSGLYTYGAFLFFLQQEFFRSYRSRSVFSLLLLRLQIVDRSKPDSLGVELNAEQMQALRKAALKIVRRSDVLAHYQNLDVAILLPATKTPGAKTIDSKLGKLLVNLSLPGMTETQSISVSIGLGSIDEYPNLTALLEAAEGSLMPPLRLK